jgi:hypothetical protein
MALNRKKNTAFESHLRHELKTLQRDRFKQRINEEISALFEWFEEVCLNDFLNADQMWRCFQRNVIEIPMSDETLVFLIECAKRIHSCMRNDETKLNGIIQKEQYDKIIENLIELEELRNEIIRKAASSSISSMMISNALYNGIKGFIISENILVKNIPGASALLKVGMDLMNITTLGLAGSIDEKMKKFVESNIQNILKDSEKFLVKKLDETFLKDLANELWKVSSQYKIHSSTEYVDPPHIESFIRVLRDFWTHFRQTAIFSKVCRTLIEYFLERHGGKKIRTFLEEIGVTEDRVLTEVNDILVPALKKGVVKSYFEKRMRARLEAYYFSKSAKADVRKPGVRKRLSMTTATDTVLTIIKKSGSTGATAAQIKKKTRFNDIKIRNVIYRLKKMDKIRSKGRGVYVKT